MQDKLFLNQFLAKYSVFLAEKRVIGRKEMLRRFKTFGPDVLNLRLECFKPLGGTF